MHACRLVICCAYLIRQMSCYPAQDGEYVTFGEVEGMPDLNSASKPFKITNCKACLIIGASTAPQHILSDVARAPAAATELLCPAQVMS